MATLLVGQLAAGVAAVERNRAFTLHRNLGLTSKAASRFWTAARARAHGFSRQLPGSVDE